MHATTFASPVQRDVSRVPWIEFPYTSIIMTCPQICAPPAYHHTVPKSAPPNNRHHARTMSEWTAKLLQSELPRRRSPTRHHGYAQHGMRPRSRTWNCDQRATATAVTPGVSPPPARRRQSGYRLGDPMIVRPGSARGPVAPSQPDGLDRRAAR